VTDPQLSPHFRLSEFTRSALAARFGLANTPGAWEIGNLRALCLGPLEWLRGEVGRLDVSSGCRALDVNRAAGGAAGSQHVKGQAADVIPAGTTRDEAFAALVAGMRAGRTVADQVITYDAKPHMHVSFRTAGVNRGQALRCLSDGRYIPWVPAP